MRFGLISDAHLAPAGTPPERWHNELDLDGSIPRLRAAVGVCRGAGVDALALLGDLANAGDEPSVTLAASIASELGTPVWAVPGNHDVLAADGILSAAIAALARPWVRAAPTSPEVVDRGIAVAGVPLSGGQGREDQLRARLPTVGTGSADLLVVFGHHPALPMRDRLASAGLAHAGDLANRDALAESLGARNGPVVMAHGHLHVRDAMAVGNLLHISCAALVEAPWEVTILEVETGDGAPVVGRRVIPVTTVAKVDLPVLSPAEQAWRWSAAGWTLQGSDGQDRAGSDR